MSTRGQDTFVHVSCGSTQMDMLPQTCAWCAGMWHSWTPPQTATAKLQDNFEGTVREVVSGDCLVVSDSGGLSNTHVTHC